MSETRREDSEGAGPTTQAGDAEHASALIDQHPTKPGEAITAQPLPEATEVGDRSSLWGDAWRQLRRDPIFIASAILIAIFVLMAIIPQAFTFWIGGEDCAGTSRTTGEACWQDPEYAELGRSAESPSSEHPFGFDVQGRDQVTRIIYGARNSIAIGVSVTVGAIVIALALGSLAGYLGKGFDAVTSRITDIFFAIPVTLAGIAFLNILPNRGIPEVAGVLIAFGWPTMMRIVRSQVISEKEREYVLAARALGSGDIRIITRHILPNSLAPVIVYATIFIGVIISAEATLSFLGVGLQLPAISWGLMVSEAQSRLLQAPHLLLFPGIFISLTVFSFILMGDALRDALDPRLR
ncbi:ABC transporter permease [Euzebya sp.]|uniref:ABC transporter permease n=1 Tax=Euzebya sp. TaxID=1971409 RepID=UPI0035118408